MKFATNSGVGLNISKRVSERLLSRLCGLNIITHIYKIMNYKNEEKIMLSTFFQRDRIQKGKNMNPGHIRYYKCCLFVAKKLWCYHFYQPNPDK